MKNFVIAGILAVTSGMGFSQVALDLSPAALKNAKPGDTVVITNGTYRDRILELTGEGTKDKPIVVRPQSPGGVIFSGKSALKLKGAFVTLSGFLFQDGYSPEKQAIAIEGTGCRLTNTVFNSYNPPDPEAADDKWVTLRGTHHRVDGCSFLNKTSKSVTVVVWRDEPTGDHHLIEGNLFSGRPKGKKSNGYETIRIGDSKHSLSHSLTTVEGNLFENCDGEMEIISVKSGQNSIRGNTFLQCAGTVTLRHGNGNLVEGNVFAGKLKKETGGVRIYGKEHVIRGNAFIGTTGRGGGVIAFQSGKPHSENHEFHRAESIIVEKNLFAANKGSIFKFDAGAGEDGRTEMPRLLTIRENNFSGDPDSPLLRGDDKLAPGDLKWVRDNRAFMNNQFPAEVTRSIPQPLSKAQVGAQWYRP